VIFMADTATIGDPHVKVGIVAGDGGVAIWPLAVGPARPSNICSPAIRSRPSEAERIGLVNRVVPAPSSRTSHEFAARLAAGAPLAVRYTKLAVNKLVKDALNVAFDTSTALELVTFRATTSRSVGGDSREAPAEVQRTIEPWTYSRRSKRPRRPALLRRARHRRRDRALHSRRRSTGRAAATSSRGSSSPSPIPP
jgi:hypothetical protein